MKSLAQRNRREIEINTGCCLATAAESKGWFDQQAELRKDDRTRRWVSGGRVGTIAMSLEEFARRVGDPHQSFPRHQWRNYDLPDEELPKWSADGNITALWRFVTRRGLVEVSDYWWNGNRELSVRACDRRAIRWFSRWCDVHAIEFYKGMRR